uniref:Uncharacterized protein n=1 Tax=Escherichia coli TaxID=562 RepID=O65940_ECOLX|nr:unknown protein [Escherichia coli]
MASPVTFCAVHKPLIRPNIASGVCVCSIVYCSNELTALNQPNSARQTTPKIHIGIRPNRPMARNDPSVESSINNPGRALCASFPLVNAPIAAPSGGSPRRENQSVPLTSASCQPAPDTVPAPRSPSSINHPAAPSRPPAGWQAENEILPVMISTDAHAAAVAVATPEGLTTVAR